VFASAKTGVEFNNVKKSWASLLARTNIKNFRWHDMRHHFIWKCLTLISKNHMKTQALVINLQDKG
jgi:hypothetical protein